MKKLYLTFLGFIRLRGLETLEIPAPPGSFRRIFIRPTICSPAFHTTEHPPTQVLFNFFKSFYSQRSVTSNRCSSRLQNTRCVNWMLLFVCNLLLMLFTTDGEGPVHYGVCSNHLQDVAEGEEIYMFVRRYIFISLLAHKLQY